MTMQDELWKLGFLSRSSVVQKASKNRKCDVTVHNSCEIWLFNLSSIPISQLHCTYDPCDILMQTINWNNITKKINILHPKIDYKVFLTGFWELFMSVQVFPLLWSSWKPMKIFTVLYSKYGQKIWGERSAIHSRNSNCLTWWGCLTWRGKTVSNFDGCFHTVLVFSHLH